MEKTLKTKLNNTFKEFRKKGFFARQNFMCCQSCAWDAIETLSHQKLHREKLYRGYVFYHKQDKEQLEKQGIVFLRYDGESISQKQTGIEICVILNSLGIDYSWDENPNSAIEVNLLKGAIQP